MGVKVNRPPLTVQEEDVSPSNQPITLKVSNTTLTDNGDGTMSLETGTSGGDVVGPASSTDNAVARWDSTTGKLLQNSIVILDDTGNFTTVTSITLENAIRDIKLSADSGIFTVQAQDSGEPGIIGLFSKDGDGTDLVFFSIWGVGTPGSTADSESLGLTYVPGTGFEIQANANGSGTPRSLSIYTESNTNQILLNTNGSVVFGSTSVLSIDETKKVVSVGHDATSTDLDLTATVGVNLRPLLNLDPQAANNVGGGYLAIPMAVKAYAGEFLTPIIAGVGYNGTKASPTAVGTATSLVYLAGLGYDGTNLAIGGYINIMANNTWTGSSHNSEINFITTSGTTTYTARLLPTGDLTLKGLVEVTSPDGSSTASLSHDNTNAILSNILGKFVFINGTTTVDLDIGEAGVRLSATDGKLTITGLGNGADENLIFNLDDTANAVSISSSTGLEEFNFLGSGTFPFMGVSGARSSLYSEATAAAGYAAVDYYTDGDDWQGGVGGSATGAGGAGVFFFYNLTHNTTNSFEIDAVASAVNYLAVINSITTVGPTLYSLGSDANVDIRISPKGSGTVISTGGVNIQSSLQCDSIVNDTGLAAGVYTPTRSAEANLDANATMTEAQYFRVGNTVTVSGRFTADPTLTATTTSFEITLPVASNIGAVEDLAGMAFCGSIVSQGAEIVGSVANNTAVIFWRAGDVTSQTWSYTFTYQVI